MILLIKGIVHLAICNEFQCHTKPSVIHQKKVILRKNDIKCVRLVWLVFCDLFFP